MANKTACIDVGNFCLVPLKGGGCGIVDSKFKEIVEKSVWSWSPSKKCIATHDGHHSSFLHNFIAPYERVTFKNGQKWDCREENLLDWCKADINKVRHRKLYFHKMVGLSDRKDKKRFHIYRMVKRQGERFIFRTTVSYGNKLRTFEEASDKAKSLHSRVFSMSKEEFIKWNLNSISKKTGVSRSVAIRDFDALKDFDVFNGEERSVAEMFQSGMSHVFQNRD